MQEVTISDHVKLLKADNGISNRHVAVTFGGISQGIGTPAFEFFQTLHSMGVDALFIRDPSQGWYSKPIAGLGAKPSEMAVTIRGLVADLFPERNVVTIGNSMGGFAAMLFGSLCGFQKSLCFSPQTFISHTLRAYHKDTRWAEQIAAIDNPEFEDVEPLLYSNNSLCVHIYYGSRDSLDHIHVSRLSSVRNVKIHDIPECEHDVSLWLRNKGELKGLLSEMFM